MMNLNSRIERIKQMMALEEKRAALQGELDSVMKQMSGLKDRLFEEAASVASPTPKLANVAQRFSKKRQARGLLKDKVMAALEAAGSMGVKVKELAAVIGTKPVNIHSWFHSALKRKAPIKKLTGGHYRLDTKSVAAATAASAKPAKATVPATNGKARRGLKRGQLTADIIAALKNAGSAGISVADLSSKLGAKYKNIYIWFATTGKKNAAVKKVGPAKYKLAA